MIHFFYENTEEKTEESIKTWIEKIITSEGKKLGEINYIFCDDEYLLHINQVFLQHDFFASDEALRQTENALSERLRAHPSIRFVSLICRVAPK